MCSNGTNWSKASGLPEITSIWRNLFKKEYLTLDAFRKVVVNIVKLKVSIFIFLADNLCPWSLAALKASWAWASMWRINTPSHRPLGHIGCSLCISTFSSTEGTKVLAGMGGLDAKSPRSWKEAQKLFCSKLITNGRKLNFIRCQWYNNETNYCGMVIVSMPGARYREVIILVILVTV